MEKYTEKVIEYFMNPRNMGEIPDADGESRIGSLICGDIMQLFLKIENNIIIDAKFKTFGCAAAIASSSVVTEIIKGKTVEEAEKVTKKLILEKLGGLPEPKVHCSLLAVDALKEALQNWKEKQHSK
ncbi:iron-sulfur cluster assembly scaffold protein [bacterium]|nr:iron-sulfur cluster assembly scaffold protein [bacterium]